MLTFKKGQLPPAKGFWSLTMYDANYFFVENPINRYSISERQPLKANPDGSVDLLIQNESPGRRQGIELASRAEGQVHPDDAALLAGREQPLDPRRLLGHPRGEKGRLKACAMGL